MTGEAAARRVLWRRGDFILAGAVALAALLLLAMLRLAHRRGKRAVVTTPGGTVTLPLVG